ncbi:MAG TPA: DUF1538 domain-containing protein [Oscillospiraceae bacterium]|nr:DUF1538 domain-containing protein [Oscillospiraceae bacterium]
MNVVLTKFKEVLFSVLPITIIVVILNFTFTPLETQVLYRFLIGACFIVIGLTVFLLGVDLGITPIGNNIGATVAKTNKIWLVGLAGLFLGFFISVAEPDLHILAGQVSTVTSGLVSKFVIVIVVSIGVAALVSLGLIRIVKNIPLRITFTVIYAVIFGLAIFTSPEFLAISFDASGATTGALAVPFMLALAMGISNLKKGSKASEDDSFGLVGLASSGAIIAVMVMNIISKSDRMTGSLEFSDTVSNSLFAPFIESLTTILYEVSLALAPILIIFLLFQKFSFKMPKSTFIKTLFGLALMFSGLILFLLGVNAGFMEVGSIVGYTLASMDSSIYVILAAAVIGMVTILAEPAVLVLTQQTEEVTSGYVKRGIVMVSLSLGVALAVALAIIKILVPSVHLWHYLLPGYIISIILSYLTPNLFVGIAFDSGGVASGPMAATFILAFAQGVAKAVPTADVLVDGFGIIAMIAMTPLLALQILGLVFKLKSKKEGIKDANEQ